MTPQDREDNNAVLIGFILITLLVLGLISLILGGTI